MGALNAAERVALQTALTNHGISHTGAVQIATEVPVAASADRAALAVLTASALTERQPTIRVGGPVLKIDTELQPTNPVGRPVLKTDFGG